MDKILAVAKAHCIPVLEDACQAHLGEWRNKKLGTQGAAGMLQLSGVEEPQLRRRRLERNRKLARRTLNS